MTLKDELLKTNELSNIEKYILDYYDLNDWQDRDIINNELSFIVFGKLSEDPFGIIEGVEEWGVIELIELTPFGTESYIPVNDNLVNEFYNKFKSDIEDLKKEYSYQYDWGKSIFDDTLIAYEISANDLMNRL